jgi:hypothetical protein
LYPINGNANHHPDNATISAWMEAARNVINSGGGLFSLQDGILLRYVTRTEARMLVLEESARAF